MAEKAGYDQPRDGYTNKHATFGVDAPPPYKPGIPPPQQGYVQQQYPMQHSYAQNTDKNSVNIPMIISKTGTLIIPPRPRDYLYLSIFVCLFCFFPTGIFAIYYAKKVNSLANAGDYEGASRMSNKARRFMISSVIIGFIIFMIVCTVF